MPRGGAELPLIKRPVPPAAAEPQILTPRPPIEGGVGDAASAALNAAALQVLSMKQAQQTYKLYNGQILPGQPSTLLAGVHSQDVSYIADGNNGRTRLPHGLPRQRHRC